MKADEQLQSAPWGEIEQGIKTGIDPRLTHAIIELVGALRHWVNWTRDNPIYRGGFLQAWENLERACDEVSAVWDCRFRVPAAHARALMNVIQRAIDEMQESGSAVEKLRITRSQISQASAHPFVSPEESVAVWEAAASMVRRTYATEAEARAAGELVYRAPDGQLAWCLCRACTLRHARRNKRRTRHDHWAMDGQDWRIRKDLERKGIFQ